jgi:hypothetical protein
MIPERMGCTRDGEDMSEHQTEKRSQVGVKVEDIERCIKKTHETLRTMKVKC